MSKKNEHVSFIGGADGPTSVFIAGKSQKLTFRQRYQRFTYRIRKYFVEKNIKPGTHTMDEVLAYITKDLQLQEQDRDLILHSEEYREMRASFMMQYEPALLDELAVPPTLEGKNEQAVQTFLQRLKERQDYAMTIPTESFDIDMHKFIRNFPDTNNYLQITIETTYGYIGGSASGDLPIRELNQLLKKIYLYYGVSEEDIHTQSARYRDLVRTLCMKK